MLNNRVYIFFIKLSNKLLDNSLIIILNKFSVNIKITNIKQ